MKLAPGKTVITSRGLEWLPPPIPFDGLNVDITLPEDDVEKPTPKPPVQRRKRTQPDDELEKSGRRKRRTMKERMQTVEKASEEHDSTIRFLRSELYDTRKTVKALRDNLIQLTEMTTQLSEHVNLLANEAPNSAHTAQADDDSDSYSALFKDLVFTEDGEELAQHSYNLDPECEDNLNRLFDGSALDDSIYPLESDEDDENFTLHIANAMNTNMQFDLHY